jgi:hypothetical protein
MKLDWRVGILYVTTMGMEGCWLYALMALLNKQVADGRLSVIGLLLLYPLAFIFNKLLRQLRWPEVCLRTISWLVWVVGMLLMVKIQLFSSLGWLNTSWLVALPQAIAQMLYTFKPELLILVSSAVLWWLGRRLAYLKVNFAASVSEFQFGLVILLITFFVTSQLRVDLADSVPTALTFVLLALLGMSIAHAQEGTSWLSGLHQGHWAGLLLISISLILILGLLIGSLVTPDLLQLVWAALKWVWGLIITAIAFIASLFPEPETAELPPAMPIPEIEPSEGFKPWTMPEPVRSGLRFGLNILWLGLILAALWRVSSDIFGWLRRKLAGMAGAEFEPLPGALRADFLSLLKRILLKLLGFRLPFRLRGKTSSILPEIASVRQIYRQLLRWAAVGGYPRRLSQTPHEYLYTLADLLPEAQDDLDLITQQYITARYGTCLPTEDELHQLRQSWHRVRQNRLKRMSSELAHE